MEKLTLPELQYRMSYDASSGHLTWLAWPHAPTVQFNERWITWWNSRFQGKTAGSVGPSSLGYVVICISKKWYLGHRIAWGFHHGRWPEHHIDHINGNRADNRITNLRDVPRQLNARNCRLWKTNSSGVSGIFYVEETGKWRAAIGRGAGAHIGMYDSKAEAIAARKVAEARLGYHPNHGRAA